MKQPRKFVAGVVTVVMLTLLSACGSTIAEERAQRTTTDNGESSELGGLGSSNGSTGDGATQDGGVTGSGSSSGSVNSSGSSTGQGRTATTARGRGAVTTRGVTDTTVTLGIATSDVDSFAKTLGVSISAGDTKAQLAAISKEIDKRGGILGRKLVFVEHKFNTAQALNDSATAAQGACATWTQDNHVFAVLSLYDQTLLECLKKADTPLIDAGAGWGLDAVRVHKGMYNRYPDFFILGAMLGDRYDDLAVDRMVARNFFQKWDTSEGKPGNQPMKLGLVVTGNANGDEALASMKRALAAHGITPALVYRSDGTLSGAGASAQNIVLQFKAAGITHVWGAGGTTLQAAEQQNYRPRYWFPIGVGVLAQVAPARQLAGSMAISITPALDNDGAPAFEDITPASVECKKIMRDAGQDYSSSSTTLAAMQGLCDSLFFFQQAIKNTGELTSSGLRRGLESLGDRASAETFSSVLSSNEHAPARAARDLDFKADCKCYVYPSRQLYTAST